MEAKQYKRPDMNEDLRLRLGRLCRNTVEEFDGVVTLDYSHLTSVLWGVCKGFQARLEEVEPGRPSAGRTHKPT